MIFKHVVSFNLKETTLSALMPDIRSKALNPVLRTTGYTGMMPQSVGAPVCQGGPEVRSEDVATRPGGLISEKPVSEDTGRHIIINPLP
jgi:hypothetical protein